MYVQLAWYTCIAFINIKFHLPGELPLGDIRSVCKMAESCCVLIDRAVEDAIISKETDCAIGGFVGEVVYKYYGTKNSTLRHTREDIQGGGLRPFRNNSLRSPLPNILNPGMCGSSDAVPVELILWASMWDIIESFTEIHDWTQPVRHALPRAHS